MCNLFVRLCLPSWLYALFTRRSTPAEECIFVCATKERLIWNTVFPIWFAAAAVTRRRVPCSTTSRDLTWMQFFCVNGKFSKLHVGNFIGPGYRLLCNWFRISFIPWLPRWLSEQVFIDYAYQLQLFLVMIRGLLPDWLTDFRLEEWLNW